MKAKAIEFSDFEKISERDESHFFDIKSKEIDGKTLQKAVVAFSNADGGELILGIKDKKEAEKPEDRWDGFIDLEKMNGLLQSIFELKPSASVDYEILTCEKFHGYLLRITVEKSPEVLFSSGKKVFIRHGAQSISIVDPEKIQELAFSKGASTF